MPTSIWGKYGDRFRSVTITAAYSTPIPELPVLAVVAAPEAKPAVAEPEVQQPARLLGEILVDPSLSECRLGMRGICSPGFCRATTLCQPDGLFLPVHEFAHAPL